MNAVSQYVLILAAQASLISAIAYIAMLIFRKSNVTVHAIGIACTLLLLASPMLVAILPFHGLVAGTFIDQPNISQALKSIDVPNISQAPVSSETSQAPRISEVPQDQNISGTLVTDTLQEPPETYAEPVFEVEHQQPKYAETKPEQSKPILHRETPSSSLRLSDISALLGLLWTAGATCLMTVRIRAYLRLRSVVMGAQRIELDTLLDAHLSKVFGDNVQPDVRICDAVSVPFVLGIFKPRIYVPSYVWNSPQHRQDVLTHEIAHIVRHDQWYHLAQRLVSILYWWQPLVHAINRRISAARENIADNYVLRGSNCSSYASTLLAVAEHCVGIRSPKNALAFLAQRPDLEQRVAAILDETRPLQVRSVLGARLIIIATALSLVCVGGGVGISTFNAFAQEFGTAQRNTDGDPVGLNDKTTSGTDSTNETARQNDAANDQTPLSASGRILDTKGNPIADCLLVVRVYAKDGTEELLRTHSDVQGQYKLDLPPIIYQRSHQGWAYKKGHNMRTVFFAVPLSKDRVATDLDITLPDQETTEIAIVSPEGNPSPDVVVRPDVYWVPMSQFSDIPKKPYRVSSQIPEEIIERIQAVTNADGKAKLVGVSPNLVFGFHAVTKDLGEQEFNLDFRLRLAQTEPFSLSPTHTVRGALHTNNPARFKGKFIELRSGGGALPPSPSEPFRGGFQNRRGPRVSGSGYAKVEVDDKGEFQIPAMAIGQVTPSYNLWGSNNIVVPVLDTKQTQFPNFKNVQEELKLEFSLIRTVEVQGRLLKADTKEPIPDACVSAYSRSLEIGAQGCTDADGKFSVNVPPGAAQVQLFHLSSRLKNYDLPSDLTINVDPSEATVQLNDLLAEPWTHWVVHLNSANDNPIASRQVALTYQDKDEPRVIYLRGESDANGNAPMQLSKKLIPAIDEGRISFYLLKPTDSEQVDPDGSLKVERRTDNEIWLVQQEPNKDQDSSATESSAPNASKNADQSQLPSDSSQRTISGRILDTKGNPLPDCQLFGYNPDKEQQEFTTHSDANGRYQVTVAANQRRKIFPAWVFKDGFNVRPVNFEQPNESSDLAHQDIILHPSEDLEIKVLSPNGEPVKGAAVRPNQYAFPAYEFTSDAPAGMELELPSVMVEKMQAVCDEAGIATIRGFSPALVSELLVKSEQYGEQIFQRASVDQHECRLSAVGAIRGSLLTDNADRFKGKQVWITSENQTNVARGSAQIELDERGEFYVPKFPVGEVRVYLTDWGPNMDVAPVLATRIKTLHESKELDFQFNLVRTVEVRGRVLAADTMKPLPDTRIHIQTQGSPVSASIPADAQGQFSARVTPGDVSISATGFDSMGLKYDYPRDVHLNVREDEILVDVDDILAMPFGEMVLYVEDSDGKPAANRDLSLTFDVAGKPKLVQSLKTDATGTVKTKMSTRMIPEFPGHGRAIYLTSKPEEFVPENQLRVVRRSRTREIWLSAKKKTERRTEEDTTINADAKRESDRAVEPNIQTIRTASGRILDTKGNPVAGCELISTVRTPEGSKEVRAKSDDDGRYEIKFPGDVRYASLYLTWTVKEGFNTRPVCFGKYLNDNPNATNLDIVLPDLQEIQIKVQTPDGRPLSNATVQPIDYQWPNGSFTADEPQGLGGPIPSFLLEKKAGVTDANGVAKLVGFSAALLSNLTVTTQEFGDQVFFGGNSNIVTCRLAPVGTIRGTVITNNPSLFEGKVIHLDGKFIGREQGTGTAKATVDAQGKFVVPAFAVGEVMVNFGSWSNKDFTPLLTTRDLTVRESQELKLHFSLLPTVEVRGRLLKADTKEPIPDSSVSIWNEAAIVQSHVRSSADGSFVGRIAPGSVKISVHSFGPLGNGYDYPEALNLDLNGDKEKFETKDLLATPYPGVTLHIEGADHKPIADRDVSIAIDPDRAEPQLLKTTKADASGTAHTAVTKDVLGPMQSRFAFYLAANSDELIPANRLYVSRTNDTNEIWLTTQEPPKPTRPRRPRVQ